MEYPAALREQLARILDWEEAHGSLERAVEGIPPERRDEVPAQLPYSCWRLLWHIRFTQQDILDFCLNSDYEEHKWPEDYWPPEGAPSDREWKETIQGFRTERTRLQDMARDPAIDLLATIPHGSGQTYLREILLTADHTAYHTGQIVAVRRCLGIWPEG
jgi:uncharacterized damage-inducible protein DinB